MSFLAAVTMNVANASNFDRFLTTISGSSTYVNYNAHYGRSDGPSIKVLSGIANIQYGFGLSIVNTDPTIYVTFGMRLSSDATESANRDFFTLRDGSGNTHMSLVSNPNSSRIDVYTGGNATTGTYRFSSSQTIPLDTRFVIQVKLKVGAADGLVELRMDGITVGSASSIDTQGGSGTVVNVLRWYNLASNTVYYSDIFIHNSLGSFLNTWLNDPYPILIQPTANGTLTDWTASTGGDAYACIDENPSNDGTDYIYSITSGHQSSFAMSNLSVTPSTIYGLQPLLMAERIDTALVQVKPIVISGATTDVGTAQAAPTTWYPLTWFYETDPHTNAAWLKAGIDAVQLGCELLIPS